MKARQWRAFLLNFLLINNNKYSIFRPFKGL